MRQALLVFRRRARGGRRGRRGACVCGVGLHQGAASLPGQTKSRAASRHPLGDAATARRNSQSYFLTVLSALGFLFSLSLGLLSPMLVTPLSPRWPGHYKNTTRLGEAGAARIRKPVSMLARAKIAV